MLLEKALLFRSFLWLSNIPFYVFICVCVYTYTIYSLPHSSFDGYLGCLHVLAIVNSAAVNIGVHVSKYGFIWIYPQERGY